MRGHRRDKREREKDRDRETCIQREVMFTGKEDERSRERRPYSNKCETHREISLIVRQL